MRNMKSETEMISKNSTTIDIDNNKREINFYDNK